MTILYKIEGRYISFFNEATSIKFNSEGLEFPKTIEILKDYFKTNEVTLKNCKEEKFEIFYEND